VRLPSSAPDWREYPQNPSRLHPAVAGRDAVREGDHATAADAYLLAAAFETGHTERHNALKAADICATLALRDSLQEVTSEIKRIAHEVIDSNNELGAQLRAVA
jgi:hypothetical protein